MGKAIVNSCICSRTCIHTHQHTHMHTHTRGRAGGLSLSLAEHDRVLKGQLRRPSGSHISRGYCVDFIISGHNAVKAKVICNLPNYLLQDDKTNENCPILTEAALPRSINISSCCCCIFFTLPLWHGVSLCKWASCHSSAPLRPVAQLLLLALDWSAGRNLLSFSIFLESINYRILLSVAQNLN